MAVIAKLFQPFLSVRQWIARFPAYPSTENTTSPLVHVGDNAFRLVLNMGLRTLHRREIERRADGF